MEKGVINTPMQRSEAVSDAKKYLFICVSCSVRNKISKVSTLATMIPAEMRKITTVSNVNAMLFVE
jgi:hypothetical protein